MWVDGLNPLRKHSVRVVIIFCFPVGHIVDGDKSTVFDDFEVKDVERTGDSIDTFKAEYSSKKMKDYKWSADAKITIEIINSKYCDPVVLNYKVKGYKENWIFPDSVTFEKA